MSDYEEYETSNQSVDLTSFDDEFATAEAPEYDEVPDGKYQARIESVKLESSQKGDPMIKFDLEVLSGSPASRHSPTMELHPDSKVAKGMLLRLVWTTKLANRSMRQRTKSFVLKIVR